MYHLSEWSIEPSNPEIFITPKVTYPDRHPGPMTTSQQAVAGLYALGIEVAPNQRFYRIYRDIKIQDNLIVEIAIQSKERKSIPLPGRRPYPELPPDIFVPTIITYGEEPLASRNSFTAILEVPAQSSRWDFGDPASIIIADMSLCYLFIRPRSRHRHAIWGVTRETCSYLTCRIRRM